MEATGDPVRLFINPRPGENYDDQQDRKQGTPMSRPFVTFIREQSFADWYRVFRLRILAHNMRVERRERRRPALEAKNRAPVMGKPHTTARRRIRRAAPLSLGSSRLRGRQPDKAMISNLDHAETLGARPTEKRRAS